ncbi:uncharacterized protein CG7065 isoform X2 [Drosophila virilis]|uniref:Uncharacterized protein n=1 Tax=Drosophila virilis TaxID=7244 RepID=B4MET7_DROVI|nr:uncharacterized protein CG7065 [Drosophila virilis]EDW63062.2 uncharacterized protein Dvir_GJ14879 [Drosophila virilis]
MSYLTGEPVPPGFEDEMARTAIIQKQIDSFKGGSLIGTEYVVELHEDGQVRPDYFCVLCNTCNDSHSIFTHWTSVTHRSNYLKTHFQKAFEVLQQLRRSSSNSNELVLNATTKLVQLIEQHYGRSMQVLAVAGDDFRRFRAKICSQVRDKFHFDECAGPDFLDELRQTIQSLKPAESIKGSRNTENIPIALDAISSEDDENFTATAGHQTPQQLSKKAARKKQAEQQPAYRAANRSPPAGSSDKPATVVAKIVTPVQLPTPKELSLQASHIAQERYKWEKFRCLLELQLKQLRDETETYESNPEKHPDYSEEWKLFWNRRYKQLQEEKKCDPNSYDYKPEWITYWKDRRVELFNISVNKIKKELKDKFKLGDEDEENTKELMERYKIRVNSPKNTAAPAAASAAATANAVRRKPNYRGANNRNGNGGSLASDAVIDISDDDQQAPAAPSARPNRRSAYPRSVSRSLSPKRGRPPPPRMGRRSRTRSPVVSRRRPRSRSRSRSPHRRSRSPYSRGRDRSLHSRGHDDYADRGRERSGDYYRERGDSYSRTSRTYEPMETFRVLDSRVYPEYSQPRQRSTSPTGTSMSAANKELDSIEEPEGPLTVVSVLRMLSALEDQLGSLGPKALNLLSKALAMEKIKPNAADDLLLNEDNCVFMETTKEKLKGILIAEVLDDPQKVRVVKKLISNIATIIFQVTSKGAKETTQQEPKHTDLVKKKEYQLPFDRQLVSSKLAGALVMNGLDNLSTDDMNKLLHFYTLLVKTNHVRRQSDRNSCLNFAEVPSRMGVAASTSNEDDGGVLDIDICELMKEVEHQLAKEAGNCELTPKSNSNDTGNSMESLTDSDLQTLLQNFKFLSNEEQVHLIGHLRKLEKLEPPRVERLRKYVNIAELSSDGESCSDYLSRVVAIGRPGQNERSAASSNTRISYSTNAAAELVSAMRRTSVDRDMPTAAKQPRRGIGSRISPNFMLDDDDDDDYNFDDLVMKANDSNGKKNTTMPNVVATTMSPNALTFKPAASKISLKDTENIIANLMGTLTNNSNQASSAAKAQQQQQQQQQQMRNMPNMSNLAQQRPQQQQPQQQQQQQGPPQSQYGPNNGTGSYYNYGGDQLSSGPSNYPSMPQQQPQQQQQQQQPYNMGNYNAYGPPMGGGGGGGYPGQINPWANNGPPQPPYNNLPQNYMAQQQPQQPPHYNNVYGNHQ